MIHNPKLPKSPHVSRLTRTGRASSRPVAHRVTHFDMVKDRSFGVIPFVKKDASYFVLLVKQRRAKYWAFPKGHAEEGESDEDAARRELKEETGIERCMLLPEVRLYSRFRFPQDGKVVAKTVVYFIGIIPSGLGGGDATLERTAEISRSLWLPYEEALEKVTHRQSRELLEEAYAHVVRPMAKVVQKTHKNPQQGKSTYHRKRYGL